MTNNNFFLSFNYLQIIKKGHIYILKVGNTKKSYKNSVKNNNSSLDIQY